MNKVKAEIIKGVSGNAYQEIDFTPRLTNPTFSEILSAWSGDEADDINPKHYKVGGIETIDFIEAKNLGYHLGNVIKYVSRAGHKEDAVKDLEKAQWYLTRAINNLKGIK